MFIKLLINFEDSISTNDVFSNIPLDLFFHKNVSEFIFENFNIKIIINVKQVEIAHCLSFPSLWVLRQKLNMLVHV